MVRSVSNASLPSALDRTRARSGNITEAAVHAQAHRRLANERFPCFASGLTAVEQVTFFRRWNDPGLQSSLRLGVGHPPLWDASAEWLLNGKAKTSKSWLRQPAGCAAPRT